MNTQKKKVAGVGTEATLKNTQLNYAPLGNLVQANLNGQRLAAYLIEELQGHADPDTLYLAIKSLQSDGQDMEALARLRGFARIIQKKLERSAQ
jgi:hypothetical protein